MNKAVIAQEGSPRELYEQPDSSFIADFIGDANLVDGEVLSVDGSAAEVSIGGQVCALPQRSFGVGSIQVAIRPDAVKLSRREGESTGLQGCVRHATYLGNQMQYEVDSELGALFVVDFRVDHAIAAGSDVSIEFSDRGLALVKAA